MVATKSRFQSLSRPPSVRHSGLTHFKSPVTIRGRLLTCHRRGDSRILKGRTGALHMGQRDVVRCSSISRISRPFRRKRSLRPKHGVGG